MNPVSDKVVAGDRTTPRSPDPSSPKILLVDDQPARLLTYEAVLEGMGVVCARAESGLDALERLLQDTFAVIVLDVNMPEMDGFETARRIREHPRFEQTPIIFVTGVNVSDLDRLRGYEVGAIDYIPLPIVPEIFRSKVALLVELFKRRTDLQTLNRQLERTRAELEAERNDAVALARKLQESSEPQARLSLSIPRDPIAQTEGHWLDALLDSTKDEVYFTDLDHRYVRANSAALREFGHDSLAGSELSHVVGKLEVFRPDGSPRPIAEAPPLRALRGETVVDEEQIVRNPRTQELRHRQVSASPVRDSDGTIIGSVSVVRDVTELKRSNQERRRAENRSAALLRLTDKFRALTNPGDLAFAAAEILGETLGVSRCGYGTIDREAETISIERDWNAPGIASIAGVLHFRDYGTYIDELKRGETVVCVDSLTDPRTAKTAPALRAIQVQSFVNMPIVEQQEIVALLFLNHDRARPWPEEELAFIRDVAERTRVAVERRRNEQALAEDLQCMGRLRDLSARLVTEDNSQILFDEILSAAIFIAKADGGTIQLLNPGSRELSFAATRGLDPQLLAQFERVSADSGSSCGQALASGQRIVLGFDPSDGEDSDGSRRAHRSFGIRSAQSTPLVSRTGRVIGMFSTHWRSKPVLREREHRFLDLLARQAADLIERQEAERSLREADRRKNEFIAILSHELRNPLVPIRNGISLLKKAPDPDGIIGKIQPMMERQIAHTVRLIDDLLDVSRITSGRIEINLSTVSLQSVVAAAVEVHRDQISANGIELHLQIQEPERALTLDSTRMAQVLSNLLSNAVKFTAAGGWIEISSSFSAESETASPQLLLTVRDTGVGISREQLPRIFDLFGSASSTPSDRSARAGLSVGLALSRKIAELHGGTLRAASDGDGRGAEFELRIPVGPLSVSSENKSLKTPPLVGVRVLVVDDNVDGADSLVLVLKALGLDVQVAYDGASAIASAAKFRPQFVLLDIGMPGMDGHEVCRRLRGIHGDSMRILAVTGWGQANDKERALEAGFDSHVTKPVDPETLAVALFGGGETALN